METFLQMIWMYFAIGIGLIVIILALCAIREYKFNKQREQFISDLNWLIGRLLEAHTDKNIDEVANIALSELPSMIKKYEE